jgi:eukaryotic-like serine/threonine-protein kinase
MRNVLDGTPRVERVEGAMLVPGSLFADRYAIECRLGSGGMGVVFAALDRELEERVALEVLDGPPDREQALDRFRREVRLARKVTHPNAARTYDIGEHEGRHYLTMELVEGPSLDQVMRGDPRGTPPKRPRPRPRLLTALRPATPGLPTSSRRTAPRSHAR